LNDNNATRREFVERITAGAIAAGIGSATPLAAARAMTAPSVKPDMAWLNGVKGSHAQLFVTPTPGGIPFLHVLNYVDTFKESFGQSYPNVIAIVGLFGMAIPLGVNDAMWAKYGLGAATSVNDKATKSPATINVFAKPATSGLLGLDAPFDVPGTASIASLQARNVRFILCNNALNFWVGRIAAGSGGNAATIRNDLVANMLPGITIVPAMVIAVNQAKEAGASYMHNG
jgi:intracellular sulfur oxidation DsrE/DsrF family protein